MSKDGFRSLIVLCYRILGPLILGLSGLAGAIALGWIDDPFKEGPLYTMYVASVFLAVFAMPVVIVVALVGSVLYVRDWPFVLPLWLVTLFLLLFVGQFVLDLLSDRASVVRGETALNVLIVAAAFAATFVGFRQRTF